MANSKNHTLDMQPDGLIWLPWFLNKTASAPERERILELLEKLRRLTAMCDAERVSSTAQIHDIGLGDVIVELSPETQALGRDIDVLFDRYHTKTVFRGARALGKGLWFRQQNVRHNYDPARETWHVTESAAAQMLKDMARDGTLHLLKQCEWCKRWFKGKANKTFCSIPCRRSHHGSSEEFKAHRRDYMRSNYKLHKERERARTAAQKELK